MAFDPAHSVSIKINERHWYEDLGSRRSEGHLFPIISGSALRPSITTSCDLDSPARALDNQNNQLIFKEINYLQSFSFHHRGFSRLIDKSTSSSFCTKCFYDRLLGFDTLISSAFDAQGALFCRFDIHGVERRSRTSKWSSIWKLTCSTLGLPNG